MFQLVRHNHANIVKQNIYRGKNFDVEYLSFPALDEISCIIAFSVR